LSDRYAVVGNPIAHSLSPRIHTLFAEQTGEPVSYTKLLAPLEDFEAVVRRFFADGGRGLNVTVPFKEQAWALSSERGADAERAGAVNTLSPLPAGGLRGDNTDGPGLLRDLAVNLGVRLREADVLVIGAGGAVRGVLAPLLAEGPRSLRIANRTAARADGLAREFRELGPVVGGGFDAIDGCDFDLLINGSAAGLQGQLPPIPDHALRPGAICYDMVYGPAAAAFLNWAREHGAGLAVDGLGMLVEQAAESFRIWRGRRPDTTPVIARLRAET
jgi:shikimate dehydrogenase